MFISFIFPELLNHLLMRDPEVAELLEKHPNRKDKVEMVLRNLHQKVKLAITCQSLDDRRYDLADLIKAEVEAQPGLFMRIQDARSYASALISGRDTMEVLRKFTLLIVHL